jgi:hypothetical protein
MARMIAFNSFNQARNRQVNITFGRATFAKFQMN